MRQGLPLALALAIASSTAAHAGEPLIFQHGGRPTAEVGAFVARATDAVTVDYNPAAIARLDGAHYQLGFDYTAPIDKYGSRTGGFEADHLITESPTLYATWHLPADYYPVAFGIGIDHRAWYRTEWGPKLFPARFRTTLQELTLWSVHPVVAYQMGERWSIGGGLRYYTGTVEEGNNAVLQGAAGPQGLDTFHVEVERQASADVDGYALDLGLHYGAESWGWGLVLDSGGKVKGNGKVSYFARDVPNDPLVRSNLDSRLRHSSTRQSFELPRELRSGMWLAFSPAWRLELDLAWAEWSTVDATTVAYSADPFLSQASEPPPATEVRPRQWKDTLSTRLGSDFDLGEHWGVAAGVAWEPSPVPDSTVEPGFPRSDAIVYGLGMTYRINRVVFDLGYSYYQYSRRHAAGQEALAPTVTSSYQARDQVFAFSASFHR
ncbi:MAG TPA: outer membrane protein transport protein [Thermoanaerobaculia bacterium]|jgi:long-chain fatty acid transport protein|nr:outer membrane protein transport protein [Thermoanaerobaculia bacterium]